jgi:fermentation-respiration switch protein FrsA (DUF1100 family)
MAAASTPSSCGNQSARDDHLFRRQRFTMERFGASTAALFAPFGVNLVLVDHRGYGRSSGKPTAALLEADGVAVFDFVSRLRGIDRSKVIVHGQSLGSFTPVMSPPIAPRQERCSRAASRP